MSNFISDYRSGSEISPWPRPVPARIQESPDETLIFFTLGDVKSPLAQASFDPASDRLTLQAGEVIENYYKDRLGIRHYAPIDKSDFPLPPTGWCSWYFYYHSISPEEVQANVRWLSDHLLEYGARVVQIDDGWQGAGDDERIKRDWTTHDKSNRWDMAELASFIRDHGLEPGIWLAPHGQSSKEVVEKWNCFIRKQDGASASETWVGRWLLDPSNPKADEYLRELFETLRSNWGYSYFKIDGQPVVLSEYQGKQEFMVAPECDLEEQYRGTLKAIREAIGRGSYLLGSWGTPLPGIGLMHGSRTGDDVVLGWLGFLIALDSIVSWNFLHNIVWYCDPDVIMLRPPLTDGMAKAWATAVGLTGHAVLTSDRLPDLPSSRVEILKKVLPAVDIRPLDLYRPETISKRIWDLKVNHKGRKYDVVGCFNFDECESDQLLLSWEELGLSREKPYHVYDFWEKVYLGCWEGGYFVDVAPASCRLITLVEAEDRPQLISTDRHITQGWIDLVESSYSPESEAYTGKSILIGGEPYSMTFAFPRTGRTFRIKKAGAEGAEAEFENHQGWAEVRLLAQRTGEYAWEVESEPTEAFRFHSRLDEWGPEAVAVEVIGLGVVKIRWPACYFANVGYLVSLNGKMLGLSPLNSVVLRRLPLDEDSEFSIRPVWLDGTASESAVTKTIGLAFPGVTYLSDLKPSSVRGGWRSLAIAVAHIGKDRSANGDLISIGTKIYTKGLGTLPGADLEYFTAGHFKRFVADVGIAHSTSNDPQVQVEFEVLGENELLWRSGPITPADPPRKIDLDISQVSRLRLRVMGFGFAQANWAEARLEK